jgi:hypothetical protein
MTVTSLPIGFVESEAEHFSRTHVTGRGDSGSATPRETAEKSLFGDEIATFSVSLVVMGGTIVDTIQADAIVIRAPDVVAPARPGTRFDIVRGVGKRSGMRRMTTGGPQ